MFQKLPNVSFMTRGRLVMWQYLIVNPAAPFAHACNRTVLVGRKMSKRRLKDLQIKKYQQISF